MAATGWLRIYFEENAYTTVPATPATSAGAICVAMLKKKNLHAAAPCALFVTDAAHEHVFERRLGQQECPLEVQEKSRKHGNLDHFRIVFRQLTGEAATPAAAAAASIAPTLDDSFDLNASTNSEYMDDADSSIGVSSPHLPFSGSSGSSRGTLVVQPSIVQQAMALDPSIVRCGYLDKRGKRNTAWKERWFAVRPNGLHYYKSHLSTEPIATIPLADAFVRACHTSCQNNHTSPFVAAPSITNLTISPPLATPHSHSSLSKCSYELEIHTILRVFFLRARSYPEMLNWIRDIEGLIPPCPENLLIDDIGTTIEDDEYAACCADDARLLSLSSLRGLLANGIAVEQLVQFETERGAERTLLAYLEIEAFARCSAIGLKPQAQLLTRAQGIFDNFLCEDALKLLSCVSSEQRSEVQSFLAANDTCPTIFDSVLSALFTQLSDYSFPAFVTSKHFQRAALKLSMLGEQSPEEVEHMHITMMRAPLVRLAPSGASFTAPEAEAMRRNSGAAAPGASPTNDARDHSSNPTTKASSGVDDSHSISAQPIAAAGLLSSLYGVGSAAVGAVGAFAGNSVAMVDEMLSSPSPDPLASASHGPSVISSQHMTPRSLASYLESVGQADAMQRSASVTAPTRAALNAANGSSGVSTATGDTDSDESGAEEVEEPSIFGVTPANSSILDDSHDRSSFSTPSTTPARKTAQHTKGDLFSPAAGVNSGHKLASAAFSASASTTPLSSVTSSGNGEDEDDFFFTTSRSRSTESVARGASSSSSSQSTLAVINEMDVRATPSASLADECATRPRQAEDGNGTIDESHPLFTPVNSSGSSSVSSEPRVSTMEPQRPIEVRRRSSAMIASNATAGVAASIAAAANTSSKWKSKSIFDDDADSDSTPITTPTRAAPAANATRTSVVSPRYSTNTMDLATLREEEVDVGDLNLDEASADLDMF